MAQGTNSWGSMSFLVYSAEPLLPARIEQQLSSALPNQETRIESFEEYEEALTHCKKVASVGVFFIHENCGRLNVASVFRQLSQPYLGSGWPTIACVIRKQHDVDSLPALLAMRDNPFIVGYQSENDFEDPAKIVTIVDALWSSYIEKVEELLIPEALQNTFAAVVETQWPAEERVFYDRLTESICAPLNLSWRDRFQVRWHYLLRETNHISPAVLSPHSALKKLIIPNQETDKSLLDIVSAKTSLPERTITLAEALLRAGREGTLDARLSEAKTEGRPGRPALLRTLAAQAEVIRGIYQDTFETASFRKVG